MAHTKSRNREVKKVADQKTTAAPQVTQSTPQPNPDVGINPGEQKAQAEAKATTDAHAEAQGTGTLADPSLAIPIPIDPSVQGLEPILNSDGLVDSRFKPYVEFGPHSVYLFIQHGMNYNYYGRCTCGHQLREFTLDEAQKSAKSHIAFWESKTPA